MHQGESTETQPERMVVAYGVFEIPIHRVQTKEFDITWEVTRPESEKKAWADIAGYPEDKPSNHHGNRDDDDSCGAGSDGHCTLTMTSGGSFRITYSKNDSKEAKKSTTSQQSTQKQASTMGMPIIRRALQWQVNNTAENSAVVLKRRYSLSSPGRPVIEAASN